MAVALTAESAEEEVDEVADRTVEEPLDEDAAEGAIGDVVAAGPPMPPAHPANVSAARARLT